MHLFEEKKEFPFETFQKLIQPKNINYKKLENLEQKNVNGNENEGDCFSWLPDEILLTIFSYLDNFYQIAICSSVNQQFYRGSQDWFTWKNMIGNHHQILDFKTLSIDNNGNIFQHGKLGLANIFTQKEQNYQENETNKLLLDSQNKLSQDLVKKPKEIFIQQINKFQKVMKDKQQIEKKSKRNQRIQGKVEILCTPFFVAMAFLCMLPIPLLLISLKLDSIIKSSWFLIYIPFFIALVYSFTGSFLMCLKSVVITDEHFLFRLFYQSSVIISVFLILLGLRTENIVKNLKLIYILIPVFLFFIIGWYNMIKTLQYEKDRLENRSTLFVDTYLLTFPLIMLFFLIVSLILLSLKLDFQNYDKKISWTSVFIPLFMADSIPLIALIFLAIFNKFRHVHEDFYSMNISFSIANIFFFVYELLILLNLIGKINIKWSLVSLPLLIPSWLLNVILLILSIRLMSGK